MAQHPFFSVVIPAFNRGDMVRQVLASVFAQQFRDFEVIVVDDGSTEDLRLAIHSFPHRVEVLRQPNSGPGAARNLGASRARGTYLAFLDSDDVWFPWTLGIYADVAARFARPAFISGAPDRFSDPNELPSHRPEQFQVKTFPDYYAASDAWRWFGASSFVIRRDAFERVRGFHHEWINGEDADLAMRLGVADGFVNIENPVTFGYRVHQGQLTSNMARTIQGAHHLLDEERAGHYPGGRARSRDRRRIITRHVRPVSLEALRRRDLKTALQLYKKTFWWNLAETRVRYLLGLPALAAARATSRQAIGTTT
jgi:glycosyltransferase involved in cell wall biosynthesis